MREVKRAPSSDPLVAQSSLQVMQDANSLPEACLERKIKCRAFYEVRSEGKLLLLLLLLLLAVLKTSSVLSPGAESDVRGGTRGGPFSFIGGGIWPLNE